MRGHAHTAYLGPAPINRCFASKLASTGKPATLSKLVEACRRMNNLQPRPVLRSGSPAGNLPPGFLPWRNASTVSRPAGEWRRPTPLPITPTISRARVFRRAGSHSPGQAELASRRHSRQTGIHGPASGNKLGTFSGPGSIFPSSNQLLAIWRLVQRKKEEKSRRQVRIGTACSSRENYFKTALK